MGEKSHRERSLRNGKRAQITNKHTVDSFQVHLKRIVPGGRQLSKIMCLFGNI